SRVLHRIVLGPRNAVRQSVREGPLSTTTSPVGRFEKPNTVSQSSRLDGVVVGSGPNGLRAAIELARAGQSMLVLEQADTLGGGLRSEEITLPGYLHDICATVLPLTLGSPFLSSLPLADFGLQLLQP